MYLKEVKQKYQNEWVVARVLVENKLGQPVDVEVIAHSKNRDDIYQRMKKEKGHTYIFYSGELPTEGYAVAFYGTDCF